MLTKLKLVLIVSAAATLPGIAQQPGPMRPLGIPAEAKFFNGKWYHVYLEKMGWDAAKQKCARLGGQLVVIPDQATWTFVKELAGTASLWIGASDERKSSIWEWVDGTRVTFSAWLSGQPDHGEGGKEHYAHTRSGGWNDAVRSGRIDDKNHVVGFICEWPKK